MDVFLICSAVLVLLYFALALNVSRQRGRTKTGIGLGDDPSGPLNKAVRTHGNAAEYVPILIALFLYFHLSGAGGWIARSAPDGRDGPPRESARWHRRAGRPRKNAEMDS